MPKQLAGIWGLLLLCLLLFWGSHRSWREPDHTRVQDFLHGKVLVRIADSRGGSGVYASMDPAPLKHFLALAGHHEETITNNTALLTKILNGGESVFVDYAGTDRFYSLTMGKMGAAERLALGLCLDMNLASSADWDLLPGIGKKTAEKIVAQREKLGALRSADDLLAVKGIGAKKLAQISPHLCEGQGR